MRSLADGKVALSLFILLTNTNTQQINEKDRIIDDCCSHSPLCVLMQL